MSGIVAFMRSIVLMAVVLMLGCDGEIDPQACTEEARSSVTLKILDADTGNALSEATIVYSVDGGPETITACTDDEALIHDCESFPLTYEVDGEFEITVSSPGYVDQTKTITIEKTEDGCHVVGKTLTINMAN